MPVAMPLTTKISQNHSKRVKQRLLTAQFGDGYFTSAPDGLNSIYEEWDISWEGVNQTDRNTIIAALQAAGTDVLTWTPPGDASQKKYQIIPAKVAGLYNEQILPGMYFSISTSIVQVR